MIPGPVLHWLLAVAAISVAARACYYPAHRRIAWMLSALCLVDWMRAPAITWTLSVALYCAWPAIIIGGTLRSTLAQIALAPGLWICGFTAALSVPDERFHFYAVLHVIAGLCAWRWIVEAILERRRATEVEIVFAMLAAHEIATLVALYLPREKWRITSGLPAMTLYISLIWIYAKWIRGPRSASQSRRSRPVGLLSSV